MADHQDHVTKFCSLIRNLVIFFPHFNNGFTSLRRNAHFVETYIRNFVAAFLKASQCKILM